MDYIPSFRWRTVPIIFLYYLEWTVTSQDAATTVGEYCKREAFEPQCGLNEVIMMEHARFGRMKIGRCIVDDLGLSRYMGCQSDVLKLLHSKCSGRRRCSVRLPDVDLDATDPCNNRDLSNYLEASYRCLQVIESNRGGCSSGDVPITAPSVGYLSSVTTEESGCGDAEHPWVIRAGQGQIVQITLIDFAHDDDLVMSGTCTVYAVIKEPSAQTTKTVCGGHEMEQVVYQSMDNTVQIQVRASSEKYFLLHYQFLGCTDPAPVADLTFRRQGNVGTWRCVESEVKWTVRCEAGSWLGEARDCTVPQLTPGTTKSSDTVRVNDVATPVSSFSWKMVLILVAIVTVGMVACVLIIAIVCLKRSRAQAGSVPVGQVPLHPLYEVYDLPAPRRVSERDVPQAYYQSLPKDYHSKKTYTDNTLAPDGRYDKPVWERPLPRPPGKGDFDA